MFTWEDYSRLQNFYWQNRESIILTREFTPELVEKIHAKAAGIGVTLNSYIITAFLKANANLNSIGIAVDARMDGNRTMSNQTTGITVDYSYNNKLSFEENAQAVHSKIYRKLDSPVNRYFILHFMPLFTPALLDSVPMHTYGLYENSVTKKLADITVYTSSRSTAFGITNLTREYIELQAEMINRELFTHFRRHQLVSQCWRKVGDQWCIKNISFISSERLCRFRILFWILKRRAIEK